jgi:hypothetical protein
MLASNPRENGFDMMADEAASPPDDLTPRVLRLDLNPPIHWNDNDYTEITIREPTGSQVLRAEAELGQQWTAATFRRYKFALIALVSGEPRQVIERMPISQLERAFDFLNRFINAAPATGES